MIQMSIPIGNESIYIKNNKCMINNPIYQMIVAGVRFYCPAHIITFAEGEGHEN